MINNKTVLIFGGDGKIAKSIVKKFLDNNFSVIAVDKKNNSNSSFNSNPNYQYYACDVTNITELSNLYNVISSNYSSISHIISAAGAPSSTEMSGILGITFEDIDKSINLNLTSHLYIAKLFIPLLINSNSTNKSFVMISSVNGIKSFDLPAYSAAKAGILGLMHSIVKELGEKNIRVNTITPGTVASKEEVDEQYYNYKYKDMMALNQFTSPDDIADTIYSITHLLKAVTGQNIIVDSGQIA